MFSVFEQTLYFILCFNLWKQVMLASIADLPPMISRRPLVRRVRARSVTLDQRCSVRFSE